MHYNDLTVIWQILIELLINSYEIHVADECKSVSFWSAHLWKRTRKQNDCRKLWFEEQLGRKWRMYHHQLRRTRAVHIERKTICQYTDRMRQISVDWGAVCFDARRSTCLLWFILLFIISFPKTTLLSGNDTEQWPEDDWIQNLEVINF